jgi:prevent-host-death family protein
MHDVSNLQRMPIRAARASFGALVDEVAEGTRVLVCRRTTPLAVLLPQSDYQELVDLASRDEQLAAVLRGLGADVDPWTTPKIVEAVVRLGDAR